MIRKDIYLIRNKYYMRVNSSMFYCCDCCHLMNSNHLPKCDIYGGTLPTCVNWYYVEVEVDLAIDRVYYEDNKFSIRNLIVPYTLFKKDEGNKKRLRCGDVSMPWD